ncbi:MAG TPA: ROK family protein [Gaiellaceae bacterium]
MSFGGIETGGTKWICAVGTGPSDLEEIVTIPTLLPEPTVDAAATFFRRFPDLEGVGIGTFGPVDLDRCSVHFGTITTTPKPGWRDTPLLSMVSERLDVPVAIDTDVNAAAIGEHRWGAGRGLDTFCYVTVGTGIGGGMIVHGEPTHGLLHPELGHMRIPHDWSRDPFAGMCPYHGDCFEGLASGRALQERYGMPAREIDDPAAWHLEAEYIALGLLNVVSVLSPQRIVLGGGVAQHGSLLPRVRERLRELAGGYFAAPELDGRLASFVVPPTLGDRAGVLGALELARVAVEPEPAQPAQGS